MPGRGGGEEWGGVVLGVSLSFSLWLSEKIMHVKINNANICIFCIKETNGINADERVFLRTVHCLCAPGKGGWAQPLMWPGGFALGWHIWVIVSWIDQECLQRQPVFQVDT